MLERHAKLIRLLLNNSNHFLSADEIANYLNVSNRTVRNDIKYINVEVLSALIVSVKGRGFKMNQDLYSIEYIEEVVSDFTNKENELLLKLGYHILMYQQPTTLDSLAHHFKLSKSEISDYLTRVQSWCNSFDITVNLTKKKGVTVNGNEMNIRNAILHLNQLSSENKTVDDVILNEIPKANINIGLLYTS
ncbi:HTH domain-containing protein, partial [Staphylococcus shinii]